MTDMRGRDILVALLVTVVWAFNFVAIKIGLADFPPFFFAGLRFLLCFFPAALLIGRGGLSWRLILAAGGFIGVGYFTLLYLGMHLGVAPGLAALVSQAQILFTALFAAPLLGQRPTSAQIGGMALAVAGLALSGGEAVALAPAAGFLLVLTAALCWGLGNVVIKKAGTVDGFRLVIWMSIVPPLPNLILSGLLEKGQLAALAGAGWSGYFALLYTVLFSTLFGWGAWAWLLRRYPAPTVAPFSLLVPVISMGMSAVMTGEPLTLRSSAAAGLMLAGLALTLYGASLGRFLARPALERAISRNPPRP